MSSKNLNITIALFLSLCLPLFPLSAQRIITGKVFFADGKPQVGGYVSSDRFFAANTIIPGLDGAYSIEVSDTTKWLYFNWDGTINPAVPIDDKKLINVFNGSLYLDFRVEYPKARITRSSTTLLSGVIMENRQPISGVSIIPMVTKNEAMPGVKSDAHGQFSLELPSEATVIKIEYQWIVQYFVLPDVPSIYLPLDISEKFLSKKIAKRLKKQWNRKKKGLK